MQQNTSENIGAIISLTIGISVAIMVLIFTGALGGQTWNLVEPNIEDAGVTDINGETFTASNISWVFLDHESIVNGSVTIYNSTGSKNTSDFNINYTDGSLKLTGDNSLNNTVCSIDYTYGDTSIRNNIKDGIISGFRALKTTGGYIPIVVLAVIVFIVLGLILGTGKGGTIITPGKPPGGAF